MYQVVVVACQQRLLMSSFAKKLDAKDYAEGIWQDAPVEVVDERTGLLVGFMNEHGTWREQLKPARRPIEVA